MFFVLPNLSSTQVTPVQAPWDLAPAPDDIWKLPKPEFRAWCVSPATKHAFWSLTEGLDACLRVADNAANPPLFLHGLIADFDADIPEDRLCKAYLEKRQQGEFLPNWVSRSHSGGVHAVWLFPAAIRVASSEQARMFLEYAHQKLKTKSFYPGLGKESWDPFQYYELGRQWTFITDTRLPENLLWLWLYESGDKIKFCSDPREISIPLDKVADRVEQLYPGRWDGGPFVVGARGKAFWVPGSETLRCAVVREGGMQCFLPSEPAFVPWSRILGREWVEQFHADRIGAVVRNLYYLEKPEQYFHLRSRGPDDVLVETYTKENAAILLRAEYGISVMRDPVTKLSEVERVLHRIRVERRVDAVCPLIYRPVGLVHRGSTTILNTARVRVLPPAPEHDRMHEWGAGFPLIADILRMLFPQPSYMKELNQHPLQYMLAYLKIAYAHGLALQPAPGHICFMCGPAGIGKTVFADRIFAPLLGGLGFEATPCEYVAFGRTEFNEDLAQSPVWKIDDKRPANRKEHDAYTNFIKVCAADQTLRVRKMYHNPAQTSWQGRLIVLMNLDQNSQYLLPAMDRSLRDKVHLFYCKGDRSYIFPPKHIGDKQLRQELPYFARFLLTWKIPESVILDKYNKTPRFGMRPYHDLRVLDAAFRQGATYGFYDALILFLKHLQKSHELARQDCPDEWVGTPAELSHEMATSIFRGQGRSADFTPTLVGINLAKLQAAGVGIYQTRAKNLRLWHIPFKIIEEGVNLSKLDMDADGELLTDDGSVDDAEFSFADVEALLDEKARHGELPTTETTKSAQQVTEDGLRALELAHNAKAQEPGDMEHEPEEMDPKSH